MSCFKYMMPHVLMPCVSNTMSTQGDEQRLYYEAVEEILSNAEWKGTYGQSRRRASLALPYPAWSRRSASPKTLEKKIMNKNPLVLTLVALVLLVIGSQGFLLFIKRKKP